MAGPRDSRVCDGGGILCILMKLDDGSAAHYSGLFASRKTGRCLANLESAGKASMKMQDKLQWHGGHY